MNEDTLRRWANDALPPEEAREVYRWMVRCTDPDLPFLLSGLLRERRDRVADRTLAAQGGFWQSLVERWADLLDAGAALWTQPGLAPVQASVDSARQAAEVWLEDPDEDGSLELELDTDPGIEVAVFLTDDSPTLVEVYWGAGGRHTIPLPAHGARATAWVFMGSGLARQADAPSTLQALLASTALQSVALRWQP